MTKSWRPEGWKTEEVKENPLHCLAPQVCADHFFEAGADALLERLRAQAYSRQTVSNGKFTSICHPDRDSEVKSGVYIFIPDEEY